MLLTARQFKNISIRGRVAYAICCLENALEFYNIKGAGWNWYLSKLWWYTELPTKSDPAIDNCYQAERWHSVIRELSPIYINDPKTSYETLISDTKVFFKEDLPTKSEYLMLKESFIQSNPVIDEIASKIYLLGCCELWCAITSYSKSTLDYLQNILNIMFQQKIHLPSLEPFEQYVFHKQGWDYDLHGFGEIFDGTKYSKFIRKCND